MLVVRLQGVVEHTLEISVFFW